MVLQGIFTTNLNGVGWTEDNSIICQNWHCNISISINPINFIPWLSMRCIIYSKVKVKFRLEAEIFEVLFYISPVFQHDQKCAVAMGPLKT